MRGAILMLACVACSGTPGPKETSPPTPDECARAIAAGLDVQAGKLSQDLRDRRVKLTASLTRSCIAMHWSRALTDCYQAARTLDELSACQQMLSKEQRADLRERTAKMLRLPTDDEDDQRRGPPREPSDDDQN